MTASTIVHVATFLQGGAGRVITDLACAQRSQGHRVIVGVSATPEPGFESYPEYLARLEASGVDIVVADSSFKRDAALNAAFGHALRERLGDDIPLVVHAHAAVPAHIGRMVVATHGSPVVQTMHGWSVNKQPAHVAQDLAIMEAVEHVVFPSAGSARLIHELGARLRGWTIVPCGIERERPSVELPASLAPLLSARQRGASVLVAIGSLTAQKNHRLVIDALPSILAVHDAHLALVGEGPERPGLQQRAAELGVADRVHFLGYVRQASSVLGAADVFIQPSLTESFGLAVVEAFRARLPVVASNIPALNELIVPDRTGFRFDPYRADTLAAAVIRALRMSAADRRAMLDEAGALFRNHFTIDRMVDRYAQVYEEVGTLPRACAASSTAADSSSGQKP